MAADLNRHAAFGEALRREREVRSVELRAIADETKIGIRFLEALEKGRLDMLPGGVFPRSFLKQYADYLGLDSERLLREFETMLKAPTLGIGKPSVRRSVAEQRGNLALLGIVGIVAVLTLLKVRSQHPDRSFEPIAPTASLQRAAPAGPAVADRVYPPAPRVPANAQRMRLSLTARESCWVAVSIDGQNVVDRILNEGESQSFEAQTEIALSVGNAGGLVFTVNDQPGISLGRSGEVRKNIVITPQSLPSYVQSAERGLRLANRG